MARACHCQRNDRRTPRSKVFQLSSRRVYVVQATTGGFINNRVYWRYRAIGWKLFHLLSRNLRNARLFERCPRWTTVNLRDRPSRIFYMATFWLTSVEFENTLPLAPLWRPGRKNLSNHHSSSNWKFSLSFHEFSNLISNSFVRVSDYRIRVYRGFVLIRRSSKRSRSWIRNFSLELFEEHCWSMINDELDC